MTKTLKDLGKLKRELDVVIPFDEIKPEYDEVFSQLKAVTLRGFRPGKFPKGWLQKRFIEQMTMEAQNRVIPDYFTRIVDEMKLRPATEATVTDLTFATKKPMNFKLTFEVQPELGLLDYQKLKLEKKDGVVEPEEIESKITQLRKSRSTFESMSEGEVAEEEDQVTIDFKRTIGEEIDEQMDQSLELDERIHPEIKDKILGMKVGEHKEFSFEITEDHMEEHVGEHVGETAEIELSLKDLERKLLPEMDADFFQQFENAENEEAFRRYVVDQLIKEKEGELRFSYHEELKKQLIQCYDEFELPESLIEKREKQCEGELRKSKTGITEAELNARKNEQLDQYKSLLRIEFILKQIAMAESLKPEEEAVARRFASMAQLWGAHPGEFIQSPLGPGIYNQIYLQISQELVLDFLVDRLVGKIEVAVVES
jgi:trigger factor